MVWIGGEEIHIVEKLRETSHSALYRGVIVSRGIDVVVKIPLGCDALIISSEDTLSQATLRSTCIENARLASRVYAREVEIKERLEKLGLYEKASRFLRLPLLHDTLTYIGGGERGVKSPVIVYEYCEATLNSFKGKKPPEAYVAAAAGLYYLHQAGYAHLDVRDPNIFLCNGSWKLGDFDAAVEIGGAECVRAKPALIVPSDLRPPELSSCDESGCTICKKSDVYILLVAAAYSSGRGLRFVSEVKKRLESLERRPDALGAMPAAAHIMGARVKWLLEPVWRGGRPLSLRPGEALDVKRERIREVLEASGHPYAEFYDHIVSRQTDARLLVDNVTGIAVLEVIQKPTNPLLVCKAVSRRCSLHAAPAIIPLSPGDYIGFGGINEEKARKWYEYGFSEEGRSELKRLASKYFGSPSRWRIVHAIFKDCIENLEVLRRAGFDTQYTAPILYRISWDASPRGALILRTA